MSDSAMLWITVVVVYAVILVLSIYTAYRCGKDDGYTQGYMDRSKIPMGFLDSITQDDTGLSIQFRLNQDEAESLDASLVPGADSMFHIRKGAGNVDGK